MKRYILSIIALVLFATTFYAQEQTAAATNDSVPALTKKELRKQKVARRNLHYNILGGPSYTPDFGAVLGGSALMTFRMNPSDTTQLRSVVPMAIAFMFNGGINLFSKPQLFFKGDRFRIFGQFSYKNTQENFNGSEIIQQLCKDFKERACSGAWLYRADCHRLCGSQSTRSARRDARID